MSVVENPLQHLGHQVYIISGGLAEPVHDFGLYLGVPRDHIRAVGIEYDRLSGEWWYNQEERPNISERYLTVDEAPLTVSDGKAQIVGHFLADQAGPAVDLFVGYGGVVDRRQVHEEAPAFITSPSLAPLLAMAAGPAALQQLENTEFRPLLKKAIDYVTEGAIEFNDGQLEERFYQAWRKPY